jgi:hypothetical protein
VQEITWTAAVSEAQAGLLEKLQLHVLLLKARKAWALEDWQSAQMVSMPVSRALCRVAGLVCTGHAQEHAERAADLKGQILFQTEQLKSETLAQAQVWRGRAHACTLQPCMRDHSCPYS